MISTNNGPKLGYQNISGLGIVYIREYDAEKLTTRISAWGNFVNLKWNGSAWIPVEEVKTVQELSPAPAAKPAFITKKALIAACQGMNPDTVLFDANRRSSNNRGHAVEVALSHFFTTTFGQQFHAVRGGAAQVANPKWFKQLYTDLAWSANDITPGSILQALA